MDNGSKFFASQSTGRGPAEQVLGAAGLIVYALIIFHLECQYLSIQVGVEYAGGAHVTTLGD